MGFFKPSGDQTSDRTIARLHTLIWILIYGGLFTLVIGLAVMRTDLWLGGWITGVGIALTAIGVFLLYVRSKIDSGS